MGEKKRNIPTERTWRLSTRSSRRVGQDRIFAGTSREERKRGAGQKAMLTSRTIRGPKWIWWVCVEEEKAMKSARIGRTEKKENGKVMGAQS